MLRNKLWSLLALVFIALAFIGAVLPGLPTTEFVLLALWASAKGSPKLQAWLIHHPAFGPLIQQWHQHKAIPKRAKIIAAISMLISASMIYLSAMPIWVKCTLLSTMLIVFFWLLSRPDSNTKKQEALTLHH